MEGAGPRLGQRLGEVEMYSESHPMLTNVNIVFVGDRGKALASAG